MKCTTFHPSTQNEKRISCLLPSLLLTLLCIISLLLGTANAITGTIDFNSIATGECLGLGTSFSVNGFNVSTVAPANILSCTGNPTSNGFRFANDGSTTLGFGNTGSVGNEGIVFTLTRLDSSPFGLVSFDFAEFFKQGDSAFSGNATSIVVRGFNGATQVTSITLTPDGVNDGPGGVTDFQNVTLPAGFSSVTSVTFMSFNSINTGTFATIANWMIDNIIFTVNHKPVADAGADQTVNEGAVVTLNGSGSGDPDGDPLTYSWTQVAGKQAGTLITLSDVHSTMPSFTAPLVAVGGATLTFQLIVNDGALDSDEKFVNINVTNVNNPPVADAGPDQTVGEGSGVILNGANSYDPDAEGLVFSWEQTGGPSVWLIASDTATPKFFAPSVGVAGATLTFKLTVSD